MLNRQRGTDILKEILRRAHGNVATPDKLVEAGV